MEYIENKKEIFETLHNIYDDLNRMIIKDEDCQNFKEDIRINVDKLMENLRLTNN